MKTRDLTWFLGLELFAIVWAGVVFSLLTSRLVAGGLAGLYFVGSASLMLYWASSWQEKWRSLCLYPLIVHLFVISLPMLVVRFLNADQPFENVHIWGLEGPQFHRLSTTVFTILMIATVVDLIRTLLHARKTRQLHSS